MQTLIDIVLTAKLALRIGQGLSKLLAVHHHLALVGKFNLFARLRGQISHFLYSKPKEILIALGVGRVGDCRRPPSHYIAPTGIGSAHAVDQIRCAGKRIQKHAMAFGTHQPLVIELAMDLNQLGANIFQQSNADSLIIGEGPRSPIRIQNPTQDHRLAGCFNTLLRQLVANCVILAQIENGADVCAFGAVTDQTRFGARTGRQPQGIQKYGFTGTRLTREYAKTVLKFQFQAFDQDHIANREMGKHQSDGKVVTITATTDYLPSLQSG